MYFTVGMPNPIDESLRTAAVRAYEAGGGTCAEVAATFGVGTRTLRRWVAQWRTEGAITARPKGGGWRSPIRMRTLEAVVAEAPDATCAELTWAYNRRVARPARTTLTSLWRALRRAGYVLKKNGRGRVKSTAPTFGGSARRS
jgi:transposase